MSDSVNAPPPALRRWFQFRLTTMLAWIAVMAFVVGLVIAPIFRAHRSRAIIASLHAEGADLQFDYQFDAQGRWIEGASPPDRSAFQTWLGEDETRRIVRVGLHGAINETILRIRPQLESFNQPFALDLSDSSVNGEGLEQLAGITRLESLNLAGTLLEDEDLSALARMSGLRDLTLPATTGNEGLAHIAGLARLRRLKRCRPALEYSHSPPSEDDYTRIREGQWLTDAGLEHLKGLLQLEELDLNFARISDRGMTCLAELTNLRSLDLSHTDITDAALGLLKILRQLERLDLSETRVLGDGLAEMAAFSKLHSLDLAACRLSREPEDVRDRRGMTAYEAEKRAAVNSAIALLSNARQLEELYLNGIDLYDESYVFLAELPRLKVLGLSHATLTATGLEYLQPARQLRELWMVNTAIDNDSVKTLKSMRSLRIVHIGGTLLDPDRFKGSRIQASRDFGPDQPREW